MNKNLFVSLACAGALMSGTGAAALQQDDLLFYASFNKDTRADYAAGNAAAITEGTLKWTVGRDGSKAVIFQKCGDFLKYEARNNLNLPQGAIAFWVKDLDTGAKKRIWNPFFRAAGQDWALLTGRLWQPNYWMGGVWRNGQKINFCGDEAGKQNEWSHIVFCWRNHMMAFYLNGKRVEELNFSMDLSGILVKPDPFFELGRMTDPARFADEHHTGLHLWKDAPLYAKELGIGKESYGAFAMDDFAIFRRPLTPAEVKAVYEHSVEQALKAGIAGEPSLFLKNHATRSHIFLYADMGRNLTAAKDQVQALVLDETGNKVLLRKTGQILPGGLDVIEIDTSCLPVGKQYKARVIVVDKSGRTMEQSPDTVFSCPGLQVWENNDYGKADVVLPGLFPLHAGKDRVDLWERTYFFKDALLPTQIRNQGEEMLASPVQWHLTQNKTPCELKWTRTEQLSAKDTRVEYAGTGSLGTLQVSGKAKVEYDGFMKFDLTFSPGKDADEVENMYMDIPLRPEMGQVLYHMTRRDASWKDRWHSRLELPNTYAITLGSWDASLQWLIESDQWFHPAGNAFALEAKNTPDAHVFRVTLIRGKKKISRPFTISFILHAGPSKPRPAGWRSWVMKGARWWDPARYNDINFKYDWWARAPGELIPRKGFPGKCDRSLFENQIRMGSLHFAGFRPFEEKNPQKRSPEWQNYEAEWSLDPAYFDQAGKAPGWNEIWVDQNSSWSQWHLYNCKQLFSLTGMRGLYYDDWTHRGSMNSFAGSGYVDENGVRHPTWPLLAQRELHRRIYAIVKEARPKDGIVIIHTSGQIFLPIVSFCDAIYDGEIMGWMDFTPPNGNYFDSYPLSYFRALFSAKLYGPVGALHDMTGVSGKRYERCNGIYTMKCQRMLWALLLTHDIHAVSGFPSGSEALMYYWLENFDMGNPDLRFHGYWEKNPAVKVFGGYWIRNGAEVPDKASKLWAVAYSVNQKVLVIVARNAPNNYSGPIQVDMTLDRKQLGLPDGPLESRDIETGLKHSLGTVSGNTLTLPVEADDFTAVVLEKKK